MGLTGLQALAVSILMGGAVASAEPPEVVRTWSTNTPEAPLLSRTRAQMLRRDVHAWMRDRIEIGTRMTAFSLQHDTRPKRNPYVGNIYKLDDDQDRNPTKVFLDLKFNEYVSLELTWDKVAGVTRNRNVDASDGRVTMGGPIVSVLGRYPLEHGIVPYGGFGLAFYDGSSDPETWWELGYPSPEAFSAAGPSALKNPPKRRSLSLDNEVALAPILGVMYQFKEHWGVDVFYRAMTLKVDASAIVRENGKVVDRQSGSFDLSHSAYGIGLRHIF
jgi:outer membrane protein W